MAAIAKYIISQQTSEPQKVKKKEKKREKLGKSLF